MTNQPASPCYEFADFHLDTIDRLLLRAGAVVRLTPKALDILAFLVRHSGHILTKEELLNAIWPDSFVEESNLARNISTLRQALGQPDYIETVPRRGYRFAARVHAFGAENTAPGTASLNEGSQSIFRSLAVLPFQPLSAPECDAYLGLRLADAVITRLSGLGSVAVSPTSAVRKYDYQEQDMVAMGGELKVDAVLGGSLQQSGKRIRLTTQLLSVRAGLPLWGAQFDAQFTDLFAVEDSLSEQVSSALMSQLIGQKQSLRAQP
ncbi:MAG: winged helix-turn-helix domain-containing protein [Acidobacteriota bacterium]